MCYNAITADKGVQSTVGLVCDKHPCAHCSFQTMQQNTCNGLEEKYVQYINQLFCSGGYVDGNHWSMC